MKQQILIDLIRMKLRERRKPNKFTNAPYSPNGYCQILNRLEIQSLIKDLRKERKYEVCKSMV